MPDNCAIDDTHVGPRRVRRTRTGAPARARVGSLVEVTLVAGKPRVGIVLAIKNDGGKWGTQWLDILFNDGEQLLIKSPTLRIINRRRRKR